MSTLDRIDERLEPAKSDRGIKLFQSLTNSSWAAGFKAVVCRHENCSRWLTQRHLSSRNVGITLDAQWYCSYRCVVSSIEHRLAQLLAPGSAPADHVARMPLGLMLVRRGLLTNEQYKGVSEEQKTSHDEIGAIVVRRGYVSERQMTTARAEQAGCPAFTVPDHGIHTAVSLPTTLLRRYSMAPLHHVVATNRLLVGFVHAIEYSALYSIEQMTDCKTQPCFISPTDFDRLMGPPGTELVPEELKFEGLQTVAEMRHTICNYGVLSNAHRIAIVRCRDYIWARLTSEGSTADLVIQAPGSSARK